MPTTSQLPRDLYRADDVRALDACAINGFGIAGMTLMERAGQAAFASIQRRWPQAQRILVLCGGGNNGGDGYVIASLA
ncbi:MAG: NAD(P)H-hydrate epimerase, partial [Gammaproteobacteria bacterium]